jgi:hypothetical protein
MEQTNIDTSFFSYSDYRFDPGKQGFYQIIFVNCVLTKKVGRFEKDTKVDQIIYYSYILDRWHLIMGDKEYEFSTKTTEAIGEEYTVDSYDKIKVSINEKEIYAD